MSGAECWIRRTIYTSASWMTEVVSNASSQGGAEPDSYSKKKHNTAHNHTAYCHGLPVVNPRSEYRTSWKSGCFGKEKKKKKKSDGFLRPCFLLVFLFLPLLSSLAFPDLSFSFSSNLSSSYYLPSSSCSAPLSSSYIPCSVYSALPRYTTRLADRALPLPVYNTFVHSLRSDTLCRSFLSYFSVLHSHRRPGGNTEKEAL